MSEDPDFWSDDDDDDPPEPPLRNRFQDARDAFADTAAGSHLDRMGAGLGISRNVGESDAAMRSRMSAMAAMATPSTGLGLAGLGGSAGARGTLSHFRRAVEVEVGTFVDTVEARDITESRSVEITLWANDPDRYATLVSARAHVQARINEMPDRPLGIEVRPVIIRTTCEMVAESSTGVVGDGKYYTSEEELFLERLRKKTESWDT